MNGWEFTVNGGTSFRKARSPLVITGARYIYNSGEEMGDIAVTANGTMSITPDNPLVPGIQFHMNTRKDVMIGNVPESSTRSLIVLVKTHQVNNWEAAGHWALNAANLPSSLPLQYNGTGHWLHWHQDSRCQPCGELRQRSHDVCHHASDQRVGNHFAHAEFSTLARLEKQRHREN
jgi:hypothetical protein